MSTDISRRVLVREIPLTRFLEIRRSGNEIIGEVVREMREELARDGFEIATLDSEPSLTSHVVRVTAYAVRSSPKPATLSYPADDLGNPVDA